MNFDLESRASRVTRCITANFDFRLTRRAPGEGRLCGMRTYLRERLQSCPRESDAALEDGRREIIH